MGSTISQKKSRLIFLPWYDRVLNNELEDELEDFS